jgi:hypothetical protein
MQVTALVYADWLPQGNLASIDKLDDPISTGVVAEVT